MESGLVLYETTGRVIRLRGAGRALCAAFDFGAAGDTKARNDREPVWDPGMDMMGATNPWAASVPNSMGLWSRSN